LDDTAALQSLTASVCDLCWHFTKNALQCVASRFLVLPHSSGTVCSCPDAHGPASANTGSAILASSSSMATSVITFANAANLRRTPGILCDAANQRWTHAASAESCLGIRTIAWLKTGERYSVAERARARGLKVTALSQFSQRHPQRGRGLE